MSRVSIAPAFNKAAWIRVGVMTFLLLMPMVIAWIFLGRMREPPKIATASAKPTPTVSAPPKSAAANQGARALGGKVVDGTGAPVPSVMVTFLPPGQSDSPFKITSDEDGSFFLDGAPAQAGTLVAKRDGYATASVPVDAGSKDVSGITLTIRKGEGVKGTVVDGEGKPVDHAIIKCDGDKGITAVSLADGSFNLPTDPEGCTATATHPDHGSSDPIKLRPGGRNVIELPSPGGISGTVVDDQGKPVPRFTIGVESFVPADKSVDPLGGMSQTVNDPGGNFTMSKLARGRYVLTATSEGHPPARSDSIEVTSGRVTSGVRIVIGKGLVLSGTVIDRSTKKPIAGARVALDAVTSAGPSGVAPATTDESGNFTLDGAPTGSFSIRVNAPEYRERIVTLDGRGKSTLRAEVDLQAGGGDATELSGIGATLGQGAGFVFITTLIPDGPAAKAGVNQGDRIVRIDGQSADSFSISDCITRLRGQEGTSVMLTVGRGTTTQDILITRAMILH